jgi:CBS domain-containing protein
MSPGIETPIGSNRDSHRRRAQSAATNSTIHAKDIMTTNVVTVGPETTVRNVALLLGEKHISAVPVIDGGSVLGIVSEGDLIHRQELGTETERLSRPGTSGETEAVNDDYAKSHGMRARDVMARNVITVFEDSSLAEVAKTLETNRIKRVLVMREATLVGIVSRADIVRALAAQREGSLGPVSSDDDLIRYKVIETLMGIPGTSPWSTTVSVSNGVVELGGSVEDEAARDPSRIAVENIPYVVDVKDHRANLQPSWG